MNTVTINRKASQIKMRILVLVSIGLMAFSTLACIDNGDNGPKLPNDLSSVPIVEGLGKACEVFGCGK